jgi:hypothetical protein
MKAAEQIWLLGCMTELRQRLSAMLTVAEESGYGDSRSLLEHELAHFLTLEKVVTDSASDNAAAYALSAAVGNKT